MGGESDDDGTDGRDDDSPCSIASPDAAADETTGHTGVSMAEENIAEPSNEMAAAPSAAKSLRAPLEPVQKARTAAQLNDLVRRPSMVSTLAAQPSVWTLQISLCSLPRYVQELTVIVVHTFYLLNFSSF